MKRKDWIDAVLDLPVPGGMNRRSALAASIAAAISCGMPAVSRAQAAWPDRPITLIDVFSPGGSTDMIARLVGNKLSTRLGQPIIVENRQGAGGMLGTNAVAKAAANGYTLLLASMAQPTSAASGKKFPFDLIKDLTPVGLIAAAPLIVVVPVDSPVKTLADLIDLARAKPNDGVRYGSSGIGSLSHLGMEMLASDAKVQMLHVPYKGVSSAVPDLLSGRLQALLGTIATFSALVESGKLRALVTTSSQRLPFLPNVPTSAEAGFPQYDIKNWWGIVAPAGTPPEVIQRLNKELHAVIVESDVRDTLARFGAAPEPGTPEQFGRMYAKDLTRWIKLINESNIKIE